MIRTPRVGSIPISSKPRASGDDPNIEANTYAIWE